jgi:hypothetical protein
MGLFLIAVVPVALDGAEWYSVLEALLKEAQYLEGLAEEPELNEAQRATISLGADNTRELVDKVIRRLYAAGVEPGALDNYRERNHREQNCRHCAAMPGFPCERHS